ncbi:IclR family transcriptional regulator [Streptomyces sp. NPDC001393]
MRTPEHRTVSRVMAILEVVVANEPQGLRLGDLSDLVRAPKSSIHGLARGLVTTGYLREDQGRYYQGPAISLLTSGRQRIPAHYHRALEQLRADWNESAILATLVGESVTNIDVVESNQLIRASPELNVRRPLWPTSYGKVFLAFMEPRRRDTYLRRKHEDARERARILDELEKIRETRIAFNREESVPGLYGLASPLILGDSDVTLAIGLVGPADRMKVREDDLARSVLETARSLSEQ